MEWNRSFGLLLPHWAPFLAVSSPNLCLGDGASTSLVSHLEPIKFPADLREFPARALRS